jgi:SAM-dependent methyltransferase
MVELARTRAEEAEVPVRYLIADAQTADLSDDGPFDLLVSRFGVMFFDDPVAAFANLRRTLTPEGRLAFCCWQGFLVNPWMSVPMLAALEYLPPPPLLGPDAPGPWAFADPDRVRSVLIDAGFADVQLDPFEGDVVLAGGGDASSVLEFLKATSLGRALLQQDDPTLAERVETSVLAALAEHEDDGEVRLGFSSWIVTARRGS